MGKDNPQMVQFSIVIKFLGVRSCFLPLYLQKPVGVDMAGILTSVPLQGKGSPHESQPPTGQLEIFDLMKWGGG